MLQIGLEKPKNCRECQMNQGEYTVDEIEKRYCYLTGRQFNKKDYKQRPKECPAGKMIDAILNNGS